MTKEKHNRLEFWKFDLLKKVCILNRTPHLYANLSVFTLLITPIPKVYAMYYIIQLPLVPSITL